MTDAASAHPGPLGRLWGLLGYFPATWRAIDQQAATERKARGDAYDSAAPQILVACAALLSAEWYWGDRPFFHELFGAAIEASAALRPYADLLAFSWWSAAKVLGFLLLPMLHIKLLGGSLRDFGMPLGGAVGHGGPTLRWGRLYVGLYLLLLPVLVLASRNPAFRETYPFYRQVGRSTFDLLAWELQYALTFLCVEFFFRGYLLFGLRRALGSHAIFVMTVPYCLLHALKPAAESFGAIVAGIVLGTLALASGSIWFGVLIHVSVAWTMDLLASLR